MSLELKIVLINACLFTRYENKSFSAIFPHALSQLRRREYFVHTMTIFLVDVCYGFESKDFVKNQLVTEHRLH